MHAWKTGKWSYYPSVLSIIWMVLIKSWRLWGPQSSTCCRKLIILARIICQLFLFEYLKILVVKTNMYSFFYTVYNNLKHWSNAVFTSYNCLNILRPCKSVLPWVPPVLGELVGNHRRNDLYDLVREDGGLSAYNLYGRLLFS